MEELQQRMLFEQKSSPNLFRRALHGEVPAKVIGFIEKYVDLEDLWDVAILQTSSPLNLINLISCRGYDESGIGSIINLKRVNDIRFINKFMESANEHLRLGGYFIGCVETCQQREQRIVAKYIWPFNKAYYVFDFLAKRVVPKLAYLKQLYFFLTNGRNRVISEMETYGRLYSCGFRLVESIQCDGQLYFVAEKTGDPDFNTGATYGPLIRLKRVGKDGKPIKVLKFRTMYPFSEYLQAYVYEQQGLQTEGGGKFKDDPRVTSMGRFFRKYWLDELPMLINWLRGDVKLMGVRPISKHYFSLYPPEFQEYRKQFKPGLIPPVYVEIPKSLEDTVQIEWRYLKAYERQPWLTDFRYFCRAFYNIFIKKVRSG